MSLRIGFFQNFKSANAVLLSGTAQDIAGLANYLRQFASTSELELSIHNLCLVSSRHPVQLYASKSMQPTETHRPRSYRWSCSPVALETTGAKFDVLVTSGHSGHQYFSLINSSTPLIVPIDEYGESWWQEHG